MEKNLEFIELYCTVCQEYCNITVRESQRLSNNFCPKFTDEECISIYLWGIANQKYDVKAIYNFINDFYEGWFPDLPAYQNFNRRICNLCDVFRQMAGRLVCKKMDICAIEWAELIHLLDSMPIIVANERRSNSARAAWELCDKGYCASKKMYYYGVKLHSLNQKQYHTLPTPVISWVTPASTSDITSAKDMLHTVYNINIFADKAYCDADWSIELADQNVGITTPVKLKKGQGNFESDENLFNSIVSSIRQSIESFFSWLQRKTNIQSASKVRSANGLFSFIFARLAAIFLF